jgi:uncharacterized protein YdeI (YjbR/CyaY-like superfamily)
MSVKPKDNLSVILFETEKLWSKWLEDNGSETAVWVRIAKKKSNVVSITYQQALEIALCFGWIDGLKKAFDEDTWIQRFSPRKPTSKWSKINKEKAKRLIAEGRMKPQGLEVIKVAKEKRTWQNAYDSPKNAKVPADLKKELDKNPKAKEFFSTLDKINQYAIIYRLQVSKTPEIRAKNLAKFIDMLLRKEKIHN